MGTSVQVNPPLDGDTLLVRVTVAANPLIDDTEIVDAHVIPAFTAMAIGLAVTVKSGIATL